MRKVLSVLFGAALVFAFTLPAQAAGKYLGAPDFKFRGWYMIQGHTLDNVRDFDDDTHDHAQSVFQRFRWWFDTSYEGKYGGTIGFEWNWTWGSDNGSASLVPHSRAVPPAVTGWYDANANGSYDPGEEVYDFGSPAVPKQVSGARWQGAHGDDQTTNWRMKHAYIWFYIPGTPVKVTAGLQGFVIDPDIIMHGSNGDWFGVRVDVPVIKGMLNLTVAWMKQDEGASVFQNSDDSDYYFVRATGALAKWFSYGTYHQWLHVRNNGVTWLDALGPATPLGGRAALPGVDGDYFWHGLWVSINPGIFYSRFHFNYFWGNMADDVIVNGALVPDFDPDGWAFVGRAGVRLGPFKVGLKGWYFSGNDDNDDWDRWSNPDAWFAPFEIFYAGARQWAVTNLGSTVPGGTAALCLESDWQVTKKLLLDLLAGYIWATEDEDKFALAAADNDDNGLGFEIDLRATYKIYDHLSLDLVGAYFIADDGLDHISPVTGLSTGGDDAYELFWRLLYTF